ncbi:hypothetical protein PQR62_20485 [Herbaspirillum lusitanum]|uniref:Gamma-glutamylcyclotransferase n=1 Tax=Herbaspirillum lusitanum TaxID=213312 RepID=A0ABW9ADU9_9BURK
MADNTPNRLVNIFFYGLHMDSSSLRAKGLEIRAPQAARVRDHQVIVREKAILLRAPGEWAYGMLFQMTHDEIDVLYSHQKGYRAEAFIVETGAFGRSVHQTIAISMVHVDPPITSMIDKLYAAKLQDMLNAQGLPINTSL